MKFIKAEEKQLDEINNIFQRSIKETYSNYYPNEVVEFFLNLHNKDHTLKNIKSGNLYILINDEKLIGTGAYDKNHITGIYILPELQNKGYGSLILNKLEEIIQKEYKEIALESSLPAVFLYEKRGYKTYGHGIIELSNNKKLVYEQMKKII